MTTAVRRDLTKTLLIMKFTAIILLFACLAATAEGYSQITLSEKNVPLQKVFKEIQKQSGYDFLFSYTLVQNAGKVTINIKNVSLQAALEELLKGKDLSYEIMEKTVVIKPKPVTLHEVAIAAPIIIALKGRVINEKGEPVAGASVSVKNSNTGTVTDKNGEFSLDVPDGNVTLIVSYVGYESQELAIGNTRSFVVSLKLSSEQLGEVVITSFGVKQNKKALGYSTQSVTGDDLLESKQTNMVSALQGKVAGLQITNSSGIPGASAGILLRGGTSLDGNNEPLFVIDGIPMDNSTIAEPANGGGQLARTVANSNRAIDINPEDVESITVLKGPAAAALYGLKASGGAIIITTKRGIAGQSKINYSSSVEFQQENKLPDLQEVYKMGTGGNAVPSRLSWGPQKGSGDKVYDNMKDFFQTGTLYANNLSFTGGTEKSSVFASVSRTDHKGIIPNSEFKRTSFRINADANLSKKFKLGFNANYTNSNGTQPLQGPGVLNGTGGIMTSMVYWPLNDNMADYLNPDGSRRRLVSNINEDIDNSYWSVSKNPITNNVNRFIGTTQISYDAFEWLNITYRLGTDFYNQDFQSLRSPGTSLNGNSSGGLYEADYFNQITTSTFLASFKKSITKDINVSLLLGHNVEWNDYRNNSVFGTNFINPDFVSINNTTTKTSNQYLSRKRILGVFGDLQLNYKNWWFVNFTGRNDWSSTLPEQNRSFFYPSVGTSIILTDLFKTDSKILSYAKLRATYAKVGKDAPPHKLSTSLVTQNDIVLGGEFGYGFYSNNASLKPEFTNSTEIGGEFQFLNKRLGLDIAWYKIESKDQITQPRVSQGTGFIFKLVNGGTIENKGFEVALNAIPIRNKKFRWDINLNWSQNRAKVTDLPVGTSVFRNSDAIAVFNLAEGASFLNGDLYALRGSTYTTNSNGDVIIGANGYPNVNKSIQKDLGVSRQPKWIAGLTNSFAYENFNLSFLIDIRKGGYVFNGTEYELVRSGLSTKTLDRGTTTILPGVVETSPGVFKPNTQQVPLDQTYYTSIYAENALNFIEDGSWYRLRYITLSYSVPQKILNRTPIKGLSFNITGKNLILITDYSGIDPELSMGGAGVRGTGTVGIDYVGLPATKGFVVGLNVTF
jgi:TonB-linked SusC/RagA family outer membrane protein